MGWKGNPMCSASGDGWKWGKVLMVGGVAVVFLHSLGLHGPESQGGEYLIGKENLLPITAAEDKVKHVDPPEYSTEIHKVKYAVQESGDTLSIKVWDNVKVGDFASVTF